MNWLKDLFFADSWAEFAQNLIMRTSELQNKALDWAVAKCEFPEPDYEPQDWLVYIKIGRASCRERV